MFGQRNTEVVIATLQTEISDLRAQLRLEREQAAKERQSLVDRILALTAPGGLREVLRSPLANVNSQGPPTNEANRPGKIHYPGVLRNPRPDRPATPPAVPGQTTFHDLEVIDVVNRAKE